MYCIKTSLSFKRKSLLSVGQKRCNLFQTLKWLPADAFAASSKIQKSFAGYLITIEKNFLCRI